MSLRFAIRDDDLNYYSAPADVEHYYRDVFAGEVPVSMATIPFVKPTSDVYPRDVAPEDVERPIRDNADLVAYVKGHPLIEILQHGCTHETVDGVYEFARSAGLFEEASRGRRALEETFGAPVRAFVAPHDALSNHGRRAVEAAGLDIVRGKFQTNLSLRPSELSGTARVLAHRIRERVRGTRFAMPRVVRIGRHREAFAYRLKDDNLSDLVAGLRHAHEQAGVFVVTNHVHHVTDARRENLLALVEEGRRLGARFVPVGALFSGGDS